MAEQYDAIVIGGGPAGSTASTVLSLDGNKVLLLEKEYHPRYQIGESLLPVTIYGIAGVLGVKEKLEAAGFTKKYGGTFKWGKNKTPWNFAFAESFFVKQGGELYSYQVERAVFDKILFDNARDKGVTVQEGCRVVDVQLPSAPYSGKYESKVSYVDPQGKTQDATSAYVIDASGSKGIMGPKVGKRTYDEYFRNLAVFGYFAGGRRFEEEKMAGNIFSEAFSEGWLWYIPLRDNLTSVGVVLSKDKWAELKSKPLEDILMESIEQSEVVRDFLKGVPFSTEKNYDEIRLKIDYSYSMDKFWTHGGVLVGDAACFIDPVFSSGVHLATYSALLAARSINSILSGNISEKTALEEFEKRYKKEFSQFYQFLVSFYDREQTEDSYFWKAHKVLDTKSSTAKEAFVKLVSGFSQSSGEGISEEQIMENMRRQSQALDYTIEGTLSKKAPDAKVLNEMKNRMGERVTMIDGGPGVGHDTPAKGARPVTEGGLVPTANWLRWIESSENFL